MRVVRKCLIPKPYDFEPKAVGEHIRREGLRRGLLQKDLTQLFNVDTFAILNWETGKTKPQIKDVPRRSSRSWAMTLNHLSRDDCGSSSREA